MSDTTTTTSSGLADIMSKGLDGVTIAVFKEGTINSFWQRAGIAVAYVIAMIAFLRMVIKPAIKQVLAPATYAALAEKSALVRYTMGA